MTPNISVNWINLYSVDKDKTAVFYNTLGLNLRKQASWSGHYDYLDILEANGQKVFFEIHSKKSESEVMDGLGFGVDNVVETLQKLIDLGVTVLRPANPRVYKYTTIATVKDPDGRTVSLYQHNR